MPDTVRALYVTGPLDGRAEVVENRPVVEAVERTGPPMPRDLEDPAWEEITITKVAYIARPLVDLDGTRVAIYCPEEEMVPRGDDPRSNRPPITVWKLATDLDAARQRIRELEDEVDDARARVAWAHRHADALAGELRDLREQTAGPTSAGD